MLLAIEAQVFLKVYFIDCSVGPIFFSPLIPLCFVLPPSSSILPLLSSCLWVVHISSLASPFPILFLTSLCLFYTCHLCLLFPVPFLYHSPLPPPHWQPSMWCPFLWFCSCSSCLLSFFFLRFTSIGLLCNCPLGWILFPIYGYYAKC